MKKISFKKIAFLFVLILVGQIIIFNISDIDKQELDFTRKKAFQEFQTEFPYEVEKFQKQGKSDEKVIAKLAERIYIEEEHRRLKDSKVRDYFYNLNSYKKNIVIEGIQTEIEQAKMNDPDSYKIEELEYEIKVIEEGYNPITFIMEKVLSLNSIDSLGNQKKYFFILLTIILFIIISIYKIYSKKVQKRQTT